MFQATLILILIVASGSLGHPQTIETAGPRVLAASGNSEGFVGWGTQEGKGCEFCSSAEFEEMELSC